MNIKSIVSCKTCDEPTTRTGYCLRHSSKCEGYEDLKEEHAESCNCGHHLGYYGLFGFSLVSEAPRNRMKIIATVEPGSTISVVCSKCDRQTDVKVEAIDASKVITDTNMLVDLLSAASW